MLLFKINSPDVYVCSFIRGHFDSHHATLVTEAKSNLNNISAEQKQKTLTHHQDPLWKQNAVKVRNALSCAVINV
jgi:superoxide dismutase